MFVHSRPQQINSKQTKNKYIAETLLIQRPDLLISLYHLYTDLEFCSTFANLLWFLDRYNSTLTGHLS